MKILNHRGETVTLATSALFPQVRTIPPGMNLVEIEVPSATKENISVALTPKIVKSWKYDATTYTDITADLTDRNTAVTVSFNDFASTHFWYVGCDTRFRGLAVDIANTNTAGGSTATVKYWNGSAWTDASATDGTKSTDTFRQDGLITWAMPTTWARTTVNSEPKSLYWVQYTVDVAFDSTVSVAQVTALANISVNTATSGVDDAVDYILIQSNAQSLSPYRFYFDPSKYGGLEMKSTSITSAANVNWYQCAGGY